MSRSPKKQSAKDKPAAGPLDPVAEGYLNLFQGILSAALPATSVENERVILVVGAQDEELSLQLAPEVLPWPVELHHLTLEDTISGHSLERIFKSSETAARFFLVAPFTDGRQATRKTNRGVKDRWLGYITFMTQVADYLPTGAEALVMLPPHFYHTERASKVRRRLYQDRLLKCVIEWNQDQGLLSLLAKDVSPWFQPQLVLLSRKTASNGIRFWKCPRLSETLRPGGVFDDLTRVLGLPAGQTRYGFILPTHLPEDAPLAFDVHHPDQVKKLADLANFGESRRLGDIAEILEAPMRPPAASDSKATGSELSLRIVTGRDFRSDGTIDLTAPAQKSIPDVSLVSLEVGDICVSAFLSPKSVLRCAIAGPNDAPGKLAAGPRLFVVRPQPSMGREERDFLFDFLRSRRVASRLRSLTPSIQFAKRHLADLLVPIPDGELVSAIATLNQAARNFDEWRLAAEEAKSQLFEFDSVQDARLHILSTGRLARLREQSARRVDDFDYRVRTQFPHPLAYRWRAVESTRPDLEGYQEILRCAEAGLCYLATLTIVMSHLVKLEVPGVADIRERLVKRGSGTSLGDWVSILRKVNASKAFRAIDSNATLYELTHFLDKDVDAAIQGLSNKRNDHAHNRGPSSGSRLASAWREARDELEVVFRAVEFVTEYPLIYIEETHRDTLAGMTNYKFRRLMGDHPLVPIEQSENASAEIECRSLHLMGREGQLHNLRPLLVRQECPTCGAWTTFHLDTYVKKEGNFALKGFEHAHTAPYSRVEDFTHYGFFGIGARAFD